MASTTAAGLAGNICPRCHQNEATITGRSGPLCQECFMTYVANKCSKQMGVVAKEIRLADGVVTRKFLVGLSLGLSSAVLLDHLHQSLVRVIGRGQRAPLRVVAVHVDTDTSCDESEARSTAEAVDRFRARYPHFAFQVVPLAAALELRTIDWSVLPSRDAAAAPADQLRALFEQLPSTTSKADILRLFIRHILVSQTIRESCHGLLLGFNTTALAELTLAETAKGRGFSLPWQVHDGPVPVVEYPAENAPAPTGKPQSIMVFYPLRELLRKDIATYATLGSPPLTDTIQQESQKTRAVVSHKDLSIEEVMVRYFEEVEQNYPSIVANVAKTTGKLVRIDADTRCRVCNMPLDAHGDARWRGEIGKDDGVAESVWNQPLCYGCKRSIGG